MTVRPHPAFTREGLNLRVTVPVTFTEAALGRDDRGADARRRPRQAARRARNPVGPRAAGQGPRRADAEGHRRPARRGAGGGAVAPGRRGARGARAVPRARAEGQPPRRPHVEGARVSTAQDRRRGERHDWRRDIDEDAPIFAIAVAAELAGMHPQTLRQYDRLGLVVPARTQGGSRRYSTRHVEQLREVARLSSDGMSLPAIARIIELEERVRELHLRVRDLEARVRTRTREPARARACSPPARPDPSSRCARAAASAATEIVLWRPRHSLGTEEDPPPEEPQSH